MHHFINAWVWPGLNLGLAATLPNLQFKLQQKFNPKISQKKKTKKWEHGLINVWGNEAINSCGAGGVAGGVAGGGASVAPLRLWGKPWQIW